MRLDDTVLESTLLVVEQLARSRRPRLAPPVVQLALLHLIAVRECPLCGAGAGQMCFVLGGFTSVFRTHPLRLRMTRTERAHLVSWALRESGRRVNTEEGTDEAVVEDVVDEDDADVVDEDDADVSEGHTHQRRCAGTI